MSVHENLLNLVVADAHAADPAPAGASPGGILGSPLIMIAVMFALFYFLLIRPQSKRAKEHRDMVTKLAKGDEVITNGGLLGRITDLDENYLTVEIASGVAVKMQRHAVLQVLPKGTLKS